MSLPFFDALHTHIPQGLVDIIAKEQIQDVFFSHPGIRRIHRFSKSTTRGLSGLFRYGRALKYDTPYDAYITLAPSFSSALMGYGAGSVYRVGYAGEGRSFLLTHRLSLEPDTHRVYSYYRLLQHFYTYWQQNSGQIALPDIPEAYPQTVRFPFSANERQSRFLQKDEGKRYIVCNVNSEAPSRRLPLETWRALGRKLLQEHDNVYLIFIGTTAEQERIRQVTEAFIPSTSVLDFSGKTTLRELAMLLRDADVVVSNDSGPMHLANAVGTPLVTFFGAGHPLATGPFNTRNAVVIQKHLACSPCVSNVCRFAAVKCLEQITVEEIYQSIVDVSDDALW